ncbi:MAG: hypothetical protein AAGA80_08395 [Cyanobacteria bacterium P01_F01_bin.143]
MVALPYIPTASSQSSEIIPFDSPRWEISGVENSIVDYLGEKSLLIKGGIAIVDDVEATDGIIEYDVAFPDERGFVGVIWRFQNPKNFEKFYIRPHQSGNPDASQYTPVINGMTAWQLYPQYGKRISFPYDEWIHVKVVISGTSTEIYVGDMNEPALFIDELKSDFASGKVGVETENFAAAYFTNFSFTPMDNPPLKGQAPTNDEASSAPIMSWLVSNTFDRKLLEGKSQLTNSDKQNLTWTPLNADSSGLINLARVQGVEEGKNTVFAKATIISATNQIKPLDIGFSDRVKVYLNDQAIFDAEDRVLSRDYRFLGTVGYYDTLYLPLKSGNNELWIEVSENFPVTGWGLQTKFEDASGISFSS